MDELETRAVSAQNANDFMKLNDRVALVTGAARGIGREIALVYSREGAGLAIADLNMDAAEAVAEDIRNACAPCVAAPDESPIHSRTQR
jgi:NAD(P)-dependent dehydrogenase (short-subunit alcohol dehydrogenase family)